MTGLIVLGNGTHAFIVTSRGAKSIAGTPCGPDRLADVWLDDVPIYRWRPGERGFDINTIDPKSIIGIEFYSGPSRRRCSIRT